MVQCHNKACSGRCQGVSDPSCEKLTVSMVTNCLHRTAIYSNPGSQDVVVF
nr:MAG TPA: Mitochondrial morphogenesis regulator [Caudoviricetes sp.]